MNLACSLLYVRDLVRMREFYGAILQTTPANTRWTDTWVLFNTGSASFALHAIPEAPPANELTHAQARESAPAKLIFAVDDVPAERARLQSLSVPLLTRSWQDPSESCDCVDPEGNIFQIAARSHLTHLFGCE